MKAKIYAGARIRNGKPTWEAEVIAHFPAGRHERWRGGGYATRAGVIKRARKVAVALGWEIQGFIEGMEP